MEPRLYLAPPTVALGLDELQLAAQERCELLATLGALGEGARGSASAAQLAARSAFFRRIQAGDERSDTVSHFALRLAFCKTRGADWQALVDAEASLLALRLADQGHGEAVAVLARLGTRYEAEYESEEAESSDDVEEILTGFRSVKPRRLAFYRVPFEHVSWLVRRRRVEMHRGMCRVQPRDMVHVAIHHFKAVLHRQMRVLEHSLLTMSTEESERLGPILARIVAFWQHEVSRQGVGNRLSTSRARARISLSDIDSLARQHFPLCMSHLHRKLRENHHLKYDGRVQYRMFLKGLGLTVQESILFFRSEFVKVIPPAKFDKEYAYHIRHSYGLEGARKDYTPLDCAQIVHGSAPRHGQYHGCPFKHWDSSTLRNEMVGRWGLDASVAATIAARAAGGQCQSACQAFFNATHRIAYEQGDSSSSAGSDPIVHHPNVYVDKSLALTSASATRSISLAM